MSKAQQDAFVEKVEVLDGSRRGDARRRAAVRIEDIAGLLQIPPKPQATKATSSTPTQAEFDALVDDVQALRSCLTAVATALQARIR